MYMLDVYAQTSKNITMVILVTYKWKVNWIGGPILHTNKESS